jgi:hypothetical protein
MKPRVHSRIRNSPLSLPILSQINPVCVSPSHNLDIHFILYSNLGLGLLNGLFSLDLSTQTLHAPLICPKVPHVPSISFFSIW